MLHADPVYLGDFDRMLIFGGDIRVAEGWYAGVQGGPLLSSTHLEKFKSSDTRAKGWMVRPMVRWFPQPSKNRMAYFLVQGLYKSVEMPLTESFIGPGGGSTYNYVSQRRITGWAVGSGLLLQLRRLPIYIDPYLGIGSRHRDVEETGNPPPQSIRDYQAGDVRLPGSSVNLVGGVKVGVSF